MTEYMTVPEDEIKKVKYNISELEQLGAGGEHAVYNIDDGQNVLKINYHSFDEPDQGEVARRNSGWMKLRDSFGEHVPLSETSIQTVKLDKGFIKQLEESGEENIAKKIEPDKPIRAQTTLQEKLTLGENRMSLTINGLNEETMSEVSIDRLQADFEYSDTQRDYSEDILEDYPSFGELFQQIDSNPQFAEQVADFTQKLIDYTEETGEAIDLSGKDNVIFYDKEGKQDYVLLDALQLESTNFARENHRFSKWLEGDRQGTNIQEVVPHDIQYLRGINALAWKTGLETRVTKMAGQDVQPFVNNVTTYLRSKLDK